MASAEATPAMIRMGTRFFKTSVLGKWFTFNSRSFAKTVEARTWKH